MAHHLDHVGNDVGDGFGVLERFAVGGVLSGDGADQRCPMDGQGESLSNGLPASATGKLR